MQQADRQAVAAEIAALRDYHATIIEELWHGPVRLERVEAFFAELEEVTSRSDYNPEDAELWYDRIVAFGELISTTIISEYLAYAGVPNRWIDMRRALVTEQRHKDAEVDLAASAPRLRAEVEGRSERIFVGQGFIGGAPDGTTTTLGREGSDYSAAVAAHILDAESMAVWKDVDGVLNADPKIFPDAVQIAELNYLDTIELAYSGAQIIHPRTIKPLQNKNIPLYVRPFGDKRKPGTVIRGVSAPVEVPILILKKDQVLLTIRSRDFVRAGGEVRGDLLALGALPHQGQPRPQFGRQPEPLRRRFVAYRPGGRRLAQGGFRRAENRPDGVADRARIYRRAVAALRLRAAGLHPAGYPVDGANRAESRSEIRAAAVSILNFSFSREDGPETVVVDFAAAFHGHDGAGYIALDVALEPFVERAARVVSLSKSTSRIERSELV